MLDVLVKQIIACSFLDLQKEFLAFDPCDICHKNVPFAIFSHRISRSSLIVKFPAYFLPRRDDGALAEEKGRPRTAARGAPKTGLRAVRGVSCAGLF